MRVVVLSLPVLTPATGIGQPATTSVTAGAQAERPAGPVAAALAPISTSTTVAEQEQFLLTAKIRKVTGVKKGVTGTQRATLSDGSREHDASIQSIDDSRQRFESTRRTEFNFRDYWGYNVAAYRLAVMLGLDMVPPSVKRSHRGTDSAFTWWVDDVVMDEQERAKTKRRPPSVVYWNSQLHVLRVFDELIGNTDRNQGNMLIDRHWKLWLIDHSRAFRTYEAPRQPVKLIHCERTMLARMKTLAEASLQEALGDYLTMYEIRSLLKRRDRIVERIEALGPAAVYDLRIPPS